MTETIHPPVKGKRVSLFVTCIVDMIYPGTGLSTLEVLERLGVTVDFPEAQTCCGQMGFNAGYRADAKDVAKHFITTFKDAEVIVAPSGSCVSMVRHFYPELFADDPEWHERMEHIVSITWELTEFIVDGLGITDVGTVLDRPVTVAMHDACHGLRSLNLNHQPRALLENVKQLEFVELPGANQCCGFGGLFAIKMPDISGAMLNDKIKAIDSTEADMIVTCDASCLTQINGGLSRKGSPKRTVHIADVLAGRIDPDGK
ncbi:MAG: (Fe-S)-binding protein [Chloroflexota bacterium]